MGRVTEKIKLTNFVAPEKSVEIEALIDTGATMISVPQKVVDELGLRKMREKTVRYANGKTEPKSIYGVVTAEIKGRAGEFDVLAEPESTQALIGQILLEDLDLVVVPSKTDPGARRVIANPRSPDMPMVES